MPLLFAVTMFVSASLLFMVQPMVAKAVLPLLGGSPAVWNGCMVFFQALLLLGYLYADRVTRVTNTRKQWMIHLAVLALPVVVFTLAVMFSQKHTPIAVVEALAPTDGSSPVISVLMILTVAIGIPFFVCSTTATLLQKWFTYTGHPSARDPYFLYAASNFGSLISLLGYPIFIEPNLTQGGQTWVWAFGFAALAGLIAFCGKAAVNPLGVPPATGKAQGKQAAAPAGEKSHVPPSEPPPTWARMAKWTALAFVPSSLMLGVTFHMTTDIASIPLLWVGPLALYLVTFIIAFSRVPPWFRILIGNLAPVMILLLVFLLISGVNPGVGLTLMLHLLTFFAAALMCHYELARDRPSPQYLTTYFLIMSLGGVLGGIFNSLLAPVIFAQDYEYKLVLVISCLMVPRLNPLGQDEKETKMSNETALTADLTAGTLAGSLLNPIVVPARWFMRWMDRDKRVAWGLDVLIPIVVGLAFWQLQKITGFETYNKSVQSVSRNLSIGVQTIHIVFVYALPVMVCFFFVDRPLRFALCVALILGITVFREEVSDEVKTVHTERSFFGILKVEQRGHFTRLVHGTTLHGTQINEHFKPHWADEFQRLTANNPFENIIVLGAHQSFNAREEPLTYYHRTGPVGAMFNELRSPTRKGGADASAHVAMVGLGTGSVSCYAQKGQKLTYYEIDPAVKRIVETPWKVMNPDAVKQGAAPVMGPFTYVHDARQRGAEIDFKMGDARLKLKEEPADRKYALLLVDAFSSDSIPVHLLTVEAVQLYLDHLTDDGILALHISNKFVKLEPVVAAIAAKHNLVARVWNDDAEGRPGKTASSWVALARKREHLGDNIGSPIGDLVAKHGDDQLINVMKEIYPDLIPTLARVPKQQEVLLDWLDARKDDVQAKQYAAYVRKYGAYTTLMSVLYAETGSGFRPIRILTGVDAWTDDYADVMRVMMIPELQAVRKFFGLPTPVER